MGPPLELRAGLGAPLELVAVLLLWSQLLASTPLELACSVVVLEWGLLFQLGLE